MDPESLDPLSEVYMAKLEAMCGIRLRNADRC